MLSPELAISLVGTVFSVRIVQERSKQEDEDANEEEQAGNEVEISKSLWGGSARAPWARRMDRFTVYNLAMFEKPTKISRKESPYTTEQLQESLKRARFLMFCIVFFAATWQLETILLVLNEAAIIKQEAASGQTDWETHFAVFNHGINYGIHGIAFCMVQAVLTFHTPVSFKYFRGLHAMTGVYGLLFAGTQLLGALMNSEAGLAFFLIVRCIGCVLLSTAFRLFRQEDYMVVTQEMKAAFELELELAPKYEGGEACQSGSGHEQTGNVASAEDEGEERTLLSKPGQQRQQQEQHQRKEGRSCPLALRREIEAYRNAGLAGAVLLGIWVVVYSCVNQGMVVGTEDRESASPVTLANPYKIVHHELGYDIVFHISYLLLLFLGQGLRSRNLVQLDVARHFLVSVNVILPLVAYALLQGESASIPWGAFVTVVCGWITSLFCMGAAEMWCIKARHYGSDPLRHWRSKVISEAKPGGA